VNVLNNIINIITIDLMIINPWDVTAIVVGNALDINTIHLHTNLNCLFNQNVM